MDGRGVQQIGVQTRVGTGLQKPCTARDTHRPWNLSEDIAETCGNCNVSHLCAQFVDEHCMRAMQMEITEDALHASILCAAAQKLLIAVLGHPFGAGQMALPGTACAFRLA